MTGSLIARALGHPLGGPARVAFRLAQAGMLLGLRQYDRIVWRGRPNTEMAAQVTVAVKTFERPQTLRRFVRGARECFSGRIVVADDSRRPGTIAERGVDVVDLPFNSGVGAGRNAALREVWTPYVLVCDDDEVFTRGTDWESAWRFLNEHPEVDGVVPMVVEVPQWYAHSSEPCGLFRGHADPLFASGTLVGGLPVIAKPPQVYLARTASIREIGWDDRLRMVDHRDFFTRASGRLLFVEDRSIRVYHARTPFLRGYRAFRDDVRTDLAYLNSKWGGPCRDCANHHSSANNPTD